VENTRALSARRDMFLDERGTGLRVTWHPERDLVVLSVWQDDSCVGTFRMSVQDVPRLSGLLAAALGDWVGQTEASAEVAGGREGRGPRGGDGEGGVPLGGGPKGGVPLGGVRLGDVTPGEGPLGSVPLRDVPLGDVTLGGGQARGGGPLGGGQAGGGSWSGRGVGGAGLSVQRRLRLSRPVLKLRGLQHRRRGSA
jgi:hypothetical protein